MFGDIQQSVWNEASHPDRGLTMDLTTRYIMAMKVMTETVTFNASVTKIMEIYGWSKKISKILFKPATKSGI